MNKLTIIGNLTRDPELRVTASGINVCNFTVAVNRRRTQNEDKPEADFFRVNAWRGLAENCAKFLHKGSKVCAVGAVSVQTYTGNDGVTRAQMELTAEDVEFLSSRGQDQQGEPYPAPAAPPANIPAGFTAVETDELPY